jgi:D-alanyl-D-alanine carboxypeptidase (penicillin-binding protein 5/6)
VAAALSMAAGLGLQLSRPLPSVHVEGVATVDVSIAGTPPALPWPATGQAAVSVPEAGVVVASGPETAAPIASLTKIMTAYLVLHDHPVGPSEAGPDIVMSAADQQDAAGDAARNDTSVPVTAGESLTERQLLDGLLVHSANDFADALARWDSGSLTAFVAKMNAAAAALGMTATHYTDPSGIDAGDVSTPRDQLRLASLAMTDPTFAAVVAQPTVTEPGAGLLGNYVPAVGTDGVVGVKSGFTAAAQACVVLAADRQVGGHSVTVLAAITGENGGWAPIEAADASGLALLDAAAGALQWRTLVSSGQRLGHLSAPWTRREPALYSAGSLTVLTWPGTRWTSSMVPWPLSHVVRPGATVATLTVTNGPRRFIVPVHSAAGITPPSLGWRLEHS